MVIPPLKTSIEKISLDHDATFLLVLDLIEKSGLTMDEVTEWIKSGKYSYTVTPPTSLPLLSGPTSVSRQ